MTSSETSNHAEFFQLKIEIVLVFAHNRHMLLLQFRSEQNIVIPTIFECENENKKEIFVHASKKRHQRAGDPRQETKL